MKEFEIAWKIGKELPEEVLREAAAKALGIKPDNLGQVVVVRRSIDARADILYRYRVQAYRKGEEYIPYKVAPYQDVHGATPVIVIGAGPAGMFAALKLLQRGFKPIVLERGKDVERRKADMARLSTEGILNPDSNYCYGEGGAGAFSDGKLFTRSSKRGDIREVLHQLVAFGASPDILIDAHPHIGTDRLPEIVKNIRRCIEEHGGEYHFDSRVTDIDARSRSGMTEKGSGITVYCGDKAYSASKVILATGHSARDIYEIFQKKGWAIEAKGFALGVRVEHPQWMINQIRYHGKYQPEMPTAEYSFVQQVEGRGVFSFCMCPGGILVPSSTEEGTVVLNGMSNAARNSKWANSGVVVQIEPGDQPEKYTGPFALMDYQRDIERAMYNWCREHGAKHPFTAPAQRMKDFCRGIVSKDLPKTSYHPGTLSAPLHELLPEHVSLRLRRALPQVDRQMKGYYTNDALLLGTESRTSSPVRLPRDPETLEHVDVPGLYPCGEGAGYAGGIVSSALDGINCAEKI
ncbi:MAG: NAD(P)/FAD-dependent oxidoreductase [Bacteroidales bacterium]|nr:NAD(P)/FAD-dependent oxidoreductase [Bacteroidales bacterium]